MSQVLQGLQASSLHHSAPTITTIAKPQHATSRRQSSLLKGTQSDFPIPRPAKRQKLEIRGPKQQTLDCFFGPHAVVKASVKIAPQQTNGSAHDTINGIGDEIVVTAKGKAIALEAAAPRPNKKLKPAPEKKEDKRTLRSQDDGPRLKSELATYFGNYEEIMFDTPRELDFINVESSLYIIDDAAIKANKAGTPSPAKKAKFAAQSPAKSQPLQAKSPTKIDLSPIMNSIRGPVDDPLTDAAFMVSHRRAERKEKQMRNIEREHAMHEKVQLDRLLEGLQGHDWLKVLGVTGVTDGEAKKFESKRDYFIAEVEALIEKFNAWKDEEKRQRLEREAVLAAEREEEANEDDEVSSAASSTLASSDLNMSASKQLQQEAAMAFAKAKRKEKAPIPAVPYRPPSPITSFYSSKHLRESALKKARNSRNALAFGLPLPEVDEHDFALPHDFVTQDVLNASARERRRRQREHATSSSKGQPP